jgi:hypothetical protein
MAAKRQCPLFPIVEETEPVSEPPYNPLTTEAERYLTATIDELGQNAVLIAELRAALYRCCGKRHAIKVTMDKLAFIVRRMRKEVTTCSKTLRGAAKGKRPLTAARIRKCRRDAARLDEIVALLRGTATTLPPTPYTFIPSLPYYRRVHKDTGTAGDRHGPVCAASLRQ